jgi:putative peptide zinc metalloprotease protein
LTIRRKGVETEIGVYKLVQARIGTGAASGIAFPSRQTLLDRKPIEVDVAGAVAAQLDPSERHPKLAEDVELKLFRVRSGNNYAMIANPRDLLHLRLDPDEYEIARLMDGTRSVADIVVERLQGSGSLELQEVADFERTLEEGGFLDPQRPYVLAAVQDRLQPRRGRRIRNFAKTLSLEWKGADGFVRAWYQGGVRFCFTRIGAVVASVLGVAGLVAFIVAQHSGRFHLSAQSAAIDTVVLLLLGLPLTFAHEMAHATALIHAGRKVKSAGVMLYFGSPAFFVDASDGLMADRVPRMIQAIAGPFAEMALAGIASLALLLLPSGNFANVMYKFAVLNYFVIFLNLIPLLELDGYFFLSDLLEAPDLRPRSLEFVQHDLWHKLRAREGFSVQEAGLGLYGIAGVAFTIFTIFSAVVLWKEIFGGLVSSLWHAGVGGRILLGLLVIVFTGPVIRGLIAAARALVSRTAAVARSVRFKFQTKWRVEAATLIDSLPAFADLSEDALSDLAGRVTLRSVRPGQTVFRQGDRATAFFVVRRGTMGMEEEDPESGISRPLRSLGRGESFGELGLLGSAPRMATARALDEAELFQIDKGTFDRLLADEHSAPSLGPTLHALAELRGHPAFSLLSNEKLSGLLEHGDWATFAPGETLIRKGESGDAFYAVSSGQVDLTDGPVTIKTLGPGSFFGEIALLRHVPRTLSVVARTPLRCFRLDKEGFDSVLADAFRSGTLKQAVWRPWQH